MTILSTTTTTMQFILLLSCLVIFSVNSQCSICGDGKQVGNPTAEVTLPGNPPLPCSQLQQIGESGQIPVAQCEQFPLFLGPCECMDAGPPTAAPVIVSTDAPVRPAGCSVCGDGKEITKPNAIFDFVGQPSVACSILQLAGEAGQIPLAQCSFLPDLITVLCDCKLIGAPSVAPVTPPTNAPVSPPPTNSPISPPPTNAPVVPPTVRPTTIPQQHPPTGSKKSDENKTKRPKTHKTKRPKKKRNVFFG